MYNADKFRLLLNTLVTTLGFVVLLADGRIEALLIWLAATLLTRIFVSITTVMRVLDNLLLFVPQQLMLGKFIVRSILNSRNKTFRWKGRSNCIYASAQEKEAIYRSYISNDMATWRNTIDAMHEESNKSNLRELELLNYEYGYVGWSIGDKRKSEAKLYLNRCMDRLVKLRNENYRVSVLDAYESAFLGFQIGLANLKAPRLGPRSLDFAKRSVEHDDNNALGFIQLGNIYFFMPPLFGGSKERAIEYYLRAEQLMAADGKGDWNYLALLVQIAGAFEDKGEIDKANSFYLKSLYYEPNFSWVKDELYPSFTKKHNIK